MSIRVRLCFDDPVISKTRSHSARTSRARSISRRSSMAENTAPQAPLKAKRPATEMRRARRFRSPELRS